MEDMNIYRIAIEASSGAYGVGAERDEAIRQLGYNPNRVQKIINRGLKYGFPEIPDEDDIILGASGSGSKSSKNDMVAVASDGKKIKYTSIKDLQKKVKKYFSTGAGKDLPDNKKYVTYYVYEKNKKGKYVKKKKTLKYSDLVKTPTTDNENNPATEDDPTVSTNPVSTTPVEDPGNTTIPTAFYSGTTNVLPDITFYIKNMLNDRTIYLPVHPEDISESFSTNYSQTELNGRSAPYQTYGGNEARSISFSAILHQDLCTEKTGNLQTIVMYLKQLVYPKYNGSIVIPPYCFLKFGDMLNCYAIMDSIDFSWGDTIIENSTYYSKCEVNFSFQELRKDSLPTVDNVFKGAMDRE